MAAPKKDASHPFYTTLHLILEISPQFPQSWTRISGKRSRNIQYFEPNEGYCYALYKFFPIATNLLCFAIAMAPSEDPAFAAISKEAYFRLLQSVKLAPRSKSRRIIVAWLSPHAMCNAESPSVSWRSMEALKSSRTWAHCGWFLFTDHIKAVRELLSLLSTSAPNLRSVSQVFLWKTQKNKDIYLERKHLRKQFIFEIPVRAKLFVISLIILIIEEASDYRN